MQSHSGLRTDISLSLLLYFFIFICFLGLSLLSWKITFDPLLSSSSQSDSQQSCCVLPLITKFPSLVVPVSEEPRAVHRWELQARVRRLFIVECLGTGQPPRATHLPSRCNPCPPPALRILGFIRRHWLPPGSSYSLQLHICDNAITFIERMSECLLYHCTSLIFSFLWMEMKIIFSKQSLLLFKSDNYETVKLS